MEQSQRILVVEDDLFLRELYTNILSGEGYKVDSAQDGKIALEKMKIGGYNLVLMDIIMPVMDGITAMKQMQTITPQAPNKCVVFLTNLDKDEDIKIALQFGNGYLIKSQITPGSLIEQVKIYLEKYK
jgi:CheY-like chemotaxis protein